MKHLTNKITNQSKIAQITKTNNDDKDVAHCQITYLSKITDITTVYPYGFSAMAPVGNLVWVSNILGNEANLVGIPYSQASRFKGLKDGEVVVGNPTTGSYVKFLANGDIEILSKGKVTINAEGNIDITSKENLTINAKNVNINASETFAVSAPTMTFSSGDFSFGFNNSGTFQGNGKFSFGTSGAAIARVGDNVEVDGKTGTITTGSSNNTSS